MDEIIKMDKEIKIQVEFKKIVKAYNSTGEIKWMGEIVKWDDQSEHLNNFIRHFFVEGKVSNFQIAMALNIKPITLENYRRKRNLQQESPHEVKDKFDEIIHQIMREGIENWKGEPQRATLNGLIVCGICGKNFNHRNNNGWSDYICQTRKNKGVKVCNARTVREGLLKDAIENHCKKINRNYSISQVRIFVEKIIIDDKTITIFFIKMVRRPLFNLNKLL